MSLFSHDNITQRYLRRYPNSKRAKSWSGVMVHIQTENGVWRDGGTGYTLAGKPDAWILPFEEAVNKIDHCGPEKCGNFIRAEVKGTLTRDKMRGHFARSGIIRHKLTEAHLQDLRSRIDAHIRESGLIAGSFRMGKSCKIVHNSDGWWAELRCRSAYFESREAVTFAVNGFIGFAGWADDINVQPILSGFKEWVDAFDHGSYSEAAP
jgi:hypothetical protein